jgi:hypothetical protein
MKNNNRLELLYSAFVLPLSLLHQLVQNVSHVNFISSMYSGPLGRSNDATLPLVILDQGGKREGDGVGQECPYGLPQQHSMFELYRWFDRDDKPPEGCQIEWR